MPPVDDPAANGHPALRLGAEPGATPGTWLRRWAERYEDPAELVLLPARGGLGALRERTVDAALLRDPPREAVDAGELAAIPLYTETTVALLPREHLLTAGDELTLDDLVDDPLIIGDDDVLGLGAVRPGATVADTPADTAATAAWVAAGLGIALVPMSLARAAARRDVLVRPVVDAPTSTMALAWLPERYDDAIERLIAVVRGRSAASTRGEQEQTRKAERQPRTSPRRKRSGGASPRRRRR